MKKGKNEKKVDLKVFTQPKDIIPDKLVPTLRIREPRVQKAFEPTNPEEIEKSSYIQDVLMEEWPAEDVLATYDFGVTVEKVFKDAGQIRQPPSLKTLPNVLVSRKRFKDYARAVIDRNPMALAKKDILRKNSLVPLTRNEFALKKREKCLRSASTDRKKNKLQKDDFQCKGI
jgi:hypothetical protein